MTGSILGNESHVIRRLKIGEESSPGQGSSTCKGSEWGTDVACLGGWKKFNVFACVQQTSGRGGEMEKEGRWGRSQRTCRLC